MDCDLQDEPKEIPRLYAKAQEGYDAVLARRYQRNDRFFKRFFSKAFYRTLGYLTGSEQDETVANFGVYSRQLIDAIVKMREPIRYFPTMVQWVGYRQTKLDVIHNNRFEGKSSYNFGRLFNLALDIILANSDKPIRLMVKTGMVVAGLSVVAALTTVVRWITGDIVVLGYTSIVVSVWLSFGLMMSTLGVVGLYVGKTFEGVKQRPIYLIAESTRASN
jgi:dolichol-phosphate mannosyltransferase